MDFESTNTLQSQLSHHFTQLLEEEVNVSKHEALFIATVVWTVVAQPPYALSQSKP